jgi:hypothetical protein
VRRIGSAKGIHEELLKGRGAVAMLNAVVSNHESTLSRELANAAS